MPTKRSNPSARSASITHAPAATAAESTATSPWSSFEQLTRGAGNASTRSAASGDSRNADNSPCSASPCTVCGAVGVELEPAWFGDRAVGDRRGRRCVDSDACLLRLMQPTDAELAIERARADDERLAA